MKKTLLVALMALLLGGCGRGNVVEDSVTSESSFVIENQEQLTDGLYVEEEQNADKINNNAIKDQSDEGSWRTREHVNSGHTDSSERFSANSEFNNGHSILTIGYKSFIDSVGDEINLERTFLSTDLFYFDEGHIDEKAFIDGCGHIGNRRYYDGEVEILDEFDEQSVVEDGYRKTMKVFIVHNTEYIDDGFERYVMSSVITVSPLEEDVRDFLGTTFKWWGEYPTQTEIDEYRQICEKIFNSVKVVSSYQGPID